MKGIQKIKPEQEALLIQRRMYLHNENLKRAQIYLYSETSELQMIFESFHLYKERLPPGHRKNN